MKLLDYWLRTRDGDELATRLFISLRTIQAILGHKSLRTTEIYMHVTQPGVEHLQDVLDRLMVDL